MANVVAHFKTNDTVEGYRVLSELGQGAASVVYLVQDPKSKQIWALKHVHRETEKDDRFLQQTVDEAEVGQKLDHPNIRKIVRLIKKTKAFFTLTDVFLVMEYLDGPSMDRKQPRTFDEALEIYQQTACGLRHMHDKGFVHADMKPNNIVVMPGPVAKVIDLGQSCKSGTIKPRIQGTPDYIAPEQVHRREITPRTDVYNLGAAMYFTFTGKTIPTALAKADSLVSRIDDSLMAKPTPANKMNPKIPERLNELIMHCVEVDPDHRPQSMEIVASRLQLILGTLRAKVDPAAAAETARINSDSNGGMIHRAGQSGADMKLPEPTVRSASTDDND